MAAYVRDGYGAFRQQKFECGWCEMLVFRVCGARQNLYVFSLYHNPDLDDRFFYYKLLCRLRMRVPLSCLRFISMAIIRSGWVRQSQIVMVLQPLTSQLCLVCVTTVTRALELQ